MKRVISTFDLASGTTRLGDMIGDPYPVAFACEDHVQPFLRQVSDQPPLLYPDLEPLRELPAEADVDALDDGNEPDGVDLTGWPALTAGFYA